jgi:hypothetical protein
MRLRPKSLRFLALTWRDEGSGIVFYKYIYIYATLLYQYFSSLCYHHNHHCMQRIRSYFYFNKNTIYEVKMTINIEEYVDTPCTFTDHLNL